MQRKQMQSQSDHNGQKNVLSFSVPPDLMFKEFYIIYNMDLMINI